MAEFLLEALSEEIPARMQKRAAAEFSQILTSELEKVGLAYKSAKHFVTPRRITVSIDGLPLQQSTVVEERRGPRVDAPAPALDGFMRSNNISLDQIEERETEKGRFYFVEIETKGKLTKEVLPAIIETSLKKFAWPKSMRWGSNSFRWVRPLHSILAVFEAEVLHGELDLGHDKLVFTNMTRGHRCCGAENINVDNFADYQDKLKKARVIIDRKERKRLIQEEAQKLADAKKLRLREDEALLEEVQRAIADIPAPNESQPFASLRNRLPWPVQGKVISGFGDRYADGKLRRTGLLIRTAEDAPVKAIHYGRVVFANWLRGFGLITIIDHGDGYMTLYGHSSSLFTSPGDWVEAGETIALAGRTGGTEEPVLYFEVRHNGKPDNPRRWLAR